VLATALVILTGVVLLGMTVGPRVLHYRTATMLTGSMSPAIEPGDMIVDVAEPAVTLKVGQIVTYHIPVEDHRVESHRVTWVHVNADGSVLFRTKGDANNGADPWTARAAAGSTIWRVKHVLPFAGDVVRALRQPMVHLVLTRVVPVLLVVSVMFAIWRPRRRDAEAA
jgi:signal peptidase